MGENDIFAIDLKDFAILEKNGTVKNLNGLCILKGTLREGYEGFVLQEVEVKVTNIDTKEVNTSNTNEFGEYFFTIRGGNYQLEITKKGCEPILEKIELPKESAKIPVVEKGFLLKNKNNFNLNKEQFAFQVVNTIILYQKPNNAVYW